jgi:hypothetical protein
VNGSRRLLLSGVVLTALLALVALASRAHRPGGGGGGGGHVPLLIGEYVGVMMMVLMVLTVAGFGMAGDRHRRLLNKQSNWRRTLGGLAILAVLGFIAFHSSDNLHLNTHAQRPNAQAGRLGRGLGPVQGKRNTAHSSDGSWLLALVLGSIAVGVAVAAGMTARHRRLHAEELDEEAALARALDEVLADTLDDLRAERDPRKAVIQVYARMERTFAAYRVPRDPAETSLEYVTRALESLAVSAGSVHRVARLFERAKFSTHEVDSGMKDDAIQALAGLRAELAFNEEEQAA